MFKKGWTGGPGRPRGSVNSLTYEVRGIARQMVSDPAYRRKLKKDLKDRKLEPSLEIMLWHYAFGRPKEQMEPKWNLDKLSEKDLVTLKEIVQRAS